MDNKTILPKRDPMGRAIADYHANGSAAKLRVLSSMFYEDEIPVETLFRSYDKMPVLEQFMLDTAKGRILDVGAGSGCHSVELMNRGHDVVAIDISELSVQVMKERGVDARIINFFDETFCEKFDTILMAMNGIGIVGKVEHLPMFFRCVKRLLAPDGQLLLDSSDLRYLFEDEDGSFSVDLAAGYYGEVDFEMRYKGVKGEPFDWLYVDYDTLEYYANEAGLQCDKVKEGEHYDYVACIRRKSIG
ncbi:MAG: class I SAM-dependent methyltransferase [Bacteroidaceae bacterium]|nr:class I SAM-dependent methyltransferase [Bacteroidaceae bacterium]